MRRSARSVRNDGWGAWAVWGTSPSRSTQQFHPPCANRKLKSFPRRGYFECPNPSEWKGRGRGEGFLSSQADPFGGAKGEEKSGSVPLEMTGGGAGGMGKSACSVRNDGWGA